MKEATINPTELDELFRKYDKAPDSYVFVPLADACRKMGRYDEALEICDGGIKRHPKYASGYVVRGKCLYDMNRVDEAREAFQVVLDIDSDNLVALKFLGQIEADADNFDGARDYFQHILDLDPENKEISDILLSVEERERAELSTPSRDDDFAGEEINLTSDLKAEPESAPQPTAEEPREVELADDDSRFEGESIAISDGDETSDELASITLADIFAKQGYDDRARKIYEEVLRKQPDNAEVRRKLEELDGWKAAAPVAASWDENPTAEPTSEVDEAPDETTAVTAKPHTTDENTEATAAVEAPVASEPDPEQTIILAPPPQEGRC